MGPSKSTANELGSTDRPAHGSTEDGIYPAYMHIVGGHSSSFRSFERAALVARWMC